jgi:asparagine synthase (glutamine-hydrolysing)
VASPPGLERQRRYVGAVRRSSSIWRGSSRGAPLFSFLANRAYQDLTRETTPCCIAPRIAGAAAGVRRYDPFLDHEVVELMFAVPGRLKIRRASRSGCARRCATCCPGDPDPREEDRLERRPVWFSGRGLDAVRTSSFRSVSQRGL